MSNKAANKLMCTLCGHAIPKKSAQIEEGDAYAEDHVPPKQFYPKALRQSAKLNLWVVPTHKRCNEAFKDDEEYFLHTSYIFVGNQNPVGLRAMHAEFKRRAKKPQTPAIMRRLLRSISSVTRGGIALPPGVLQLPVDWARLERVAIKIAQGLHFIEKGHHLPASTCVDIRLCEKPEEVPELYEFFWVESLRKAVAPAVFTFAHFEFDGLVLYSMLFWDAFVWCLAFNPTIAA